MAQDLEALTGSDRAGIIVVQDKRVGEHTHEARAQLRSLPLLFHYGFDEVIHTGVWENDFRPVDYTFHDSGDVTAAELSFPLIHVVSQEALLDPTEEGSIERRGEQHLMRSLLQERKEDETYIIVSDTDAPKTPAYAERPATHDFSPVTTINYGSHIRRVVKSTLNSSIPMSDTKNFWYHLISNHHQQYDAPANTLPELFDYSKAPPNSPVWWPLYYFVNHDLNQILEKYTERIREALRSWTERGDVQKIANNMDVMLVQSKFHEKGLEDQRLENANTYGINESEVINYSNA